MWYGVLKGAESRTKSKIWNSMKNPAIPYAGAQIFPIFDQNLIDIEYHWYKFYIKIAIFNTGSK